MSRVKDWLVIGAIIVVFGTSSAAQENKNALPSFPSATTPANGGGDVADAWSMLKTEVAEAHQAYRAAMTSHASKQTLQRLFDVYARINDANVGKALALARQGPASPTALEILEWIVCNGRIVSRPLLPYGFQAVELLTNHTTNPKIGRACWSIASNWDWRHQPTIDFLRAVIAKNPDRSARGHATFALGELKKTMADNWEFWQNYPVAGTWPEPGGVKTGFREFRQTDLEAVRSESEQLFKVVFDKYGDCAVVGHSGVTLGEKASLKLLELRALSVSRMAPEIEGEDIDGRKLKLTDFRGKVVALSFWATWCGPCMSMVPEERALVKRMKGKPFVLIGVNGDSNRDRLKPVIQKEGIIWRSFWDGGDQKIAKAWHVEAWPTVYVLDSKGVIRFKNMAGEGLDATVVRLLNEMEDAKRR